MTPPMNPHQKPQEDVVGNAAKFMRHDGLCAIIGGYGFCSCGRDAAYDALIAAPTYEAGRRDMGGAAKVEIVRDMDVPKGAWDFIDAIAQAADGPHRRIETPNDASVVAFWHNERPAAFVLNLRDQFNHSVQLRVALPTEPLGGEG